MLVRYYKDKELTYTSRKRYKMFNFTPFYEEEQKAVLLGDGASTTLKTNKENICDYVTIDETRWFVTSYIYMNGKQVQLNLQRDVIGEFGISDCYGKIERGYTDSILKYRKELSLNQILKNRKKVIPNSNIYGNFSVNNHDNEMWGILYLVKPSGLDPNTGEPYPEKVNINIPAFEPKTVDFDFIENGTIKDLGYSDDIEIIIQIKFKNSNNQYSVRIVFKGTNDSLTARAFVTNVIATETYDIEYDVDVKNNETARLNAATAIGRHIGEVIIRNKDNPDSVFTFPEIPVITESYTNYNNVVIEKDNKFYAYTTSNIETHRYGRVGSKSSILDFIYSETNNKTITYYDENYKEVSLTLKLRIDAGDKLVAFSNIKVMSELYQCRELTEFESGNIIIDMSQNLIDEPYTILAFPLFDVEISGASNYKIDRKTAFMIFNTVIQFLSGENPYLVDAQIYPYCPVLTGVTSEIEGYPFFSINSTSYNHHCSVQLLPYSDIKKEYIIRQYSIISPEQSGKFDFNFYDYTNKVEDNNGINYAKLDIVVKTALKPFAIVSSAVIQRTSDSLIGIPYDSDLRGSQPSGNGFECSLASNAFETYKRQNSNYQQIFALQKDELQLQHEVELTNDITSTVVNTAAATAMGAIAGANMAVVIYATMKNTYNKQLLTCK